METKGKTMTDSILEQVRFGSSDGLVPAIIQDAATRSVLMLGYMNREALEKTLAEGRVTFFSRSRQRLWTKGEQSGNFLTLRGVELDCDGDALLVQAEPAGPVCHTGTVTCWGDGDQDGDQDGDLPHAQDRDFVQDRDVERDVDRTPNSYESVAELFAYLEDTIAARKAGAGQREGSYVSSLFEKGINKIAQKVGEEAVELVIEAKDSNDPLFLNEAADLLFHWLILLQAKGYRLQDVTRVLDERRP